MTYFYVTMGNMLGNGWLITVIALQPISLPLEIYTIVKSGKNLKEIKRDIAKHLSQLESDVITNEVDQNELIKKNIKNWYLFTNFLIFIIKYRFTC